MDKPIYRTLYLSLEDYKQVPAEFYQGFYYPILKKDGRHGKAFSNYGRRELIRRMARKRFGGEWFLHSEIEEGRKVFYLLAKKGTISNEGYCMGSLDFRFNKWVDRDGIPQRIADFDIIFE